MNHLCLEPARQVVPEVTELIRGQEQRLLQQLHPLVHSQEVSLDLSPVRRIDAAGVSALVQLYCAARAAGHCFVVSNPRPHVGQILTMLGLERVLMSHNMRIGSQSGTAYERTAA